MAKRIRYRCGEWMEMDSGRNYTTEQGKEKYTGIIRKGNELKELKLCKLKFFSSKKTQHTCVKQCKKMNHLLIVLVIRAQTKLMHHQILKKNFFLGQLKAFYFMKSNKNWWKTESVIKRRHF